MRSVLWGLIFPTSNLIASGFSRFFLNRETTIEYRSFARKQKIHSIECKITSSCVIFISIVVPGWWLLGNIRFSIIKNPSETILVQLMYCDFMKVRKITTKYLVAIFAFFLLYGRFFHTHLTLKTLLLWFQNNEKVQSMSQK